MDFKEIKGKIETVAANLNKNKELRKQFDTNPTAVIEEIIGVDLPDEIVNQIVAGIRAKLAQDKLGCMLSGLGQILSKKN